MKAQITLTVAGGKRLIAKAVAALPITRSTLEKGRVVLIGGSTVSAVSEEMGYVPLWISGRFDPTGARTAGAATHTDPHTLLIADGRSENAKGRVKEVIDSLGGDDLIICGANALFVDEEVERPSFAFPGRAVLALGDRKGSVRGEALTLAGARKTPTVIACGLEKLIPGRMETVLKTVDQKGTDLSLGSAIDLIPIAGSVVTELEAFSVLFGVKTTAISSGGIFGGEGCKTFAIEGGEEAVQKALDYALTLANAETSGAPLSLPPCVPPCNHCGRHLACVYVRHCKNG